MTAVALMISTTFAASGAQADSPSVSEIQVRLVTMRQDLNGLYARSAAASEQVNGATYRLDRARADLTKRRAAQKKAQTSVDENREIVAAATVERLQTNPSGRALASVLDGQEPSDLLQQQSARSAVDEAMAAKLDALDARQAVLDAAADSVAASVADQKEARAQQVAAQRTIDTSIGEAEQLAAAAEAKRDALLSQLAAAQDRPVADVTRAQDAVDKKIDESGPSGSPVAAAPVADAPAATRPATNPAAPKPAAPKPTAPKPKPADPPPAASSKVDKAVAFAKAQLGEKYVWGGAGPSSWDCSGLTMRAWQAAGVGMSHYAGSQYTGFKKVSVSKIRRGDLLFWSNGSVGSIYHVAMYLGGGKMIQAPRPGRSVEIVPLSYWIKPDLASRPG